jgi:flagellin-like hook-associated protein FlgL
MSSITLSQAVRSNLLSLQNTASLLDTTQTRLATGNKVNSALDNPTSYFTAAGLNSRASDLGNLLDSVSNAIQTIQAANDGITSITKLVESAQATANQALQLQATVSTTTAATAGTVTAGAFSTIDVSGTASAATNAAVTSTVDLTAGLTDPGSNVTFSINSQTVTLTTGTGTGTGGAFTLSDIETAINGTASVGVNATDDGSGHLVLTSTGTAGASDAIVTSGLATAGLGIPDGTVNGSAAAAADSLSFTVTLDGGSAQTVTLTAATISAYNTANSSATVNANSLSAANVASVINYQLGATVATVASGALVFTSTTTGASSSVAVSNVTSAGTPTGSTGITAASNTGSAASTSSAANPARAALISQYNGLLDQIDQLTGDAGYNGNNLLTGSSTTLKVTFNETGTSSLTITGKDTTFTGLGLAKLASTGFDANSGITTVLGNLKTAQDTLRADASSFGSNLSIVQTRQEFTKALINTLQTGASNLTLADSNEEAANLLALQTRQSLSTKALSLASQSDQNVLRLLQ